MSRIKRKRRHRPVRRKIENDSTVPLPSDWSSFTSLEENKADLAILLSTHLIDHNSTESAMIVVAGEFSESTTVKSSDPDLDVSSLPADHEECDTRLILHCIHAHMNTIVIPVRDTDVLLLLAHYSRIDCIRLYMKAGTSKAPTYLPVHEILQNLSVEQLDTLLAFHAVTGCNNVSQFSGHGIKKKPAWQVFQQHHTALFGLGKGPVTDHIVMSTEKFICKMYGVPEVDTCNKARVKLFCIGRAHESLPPTSDATKFHIMRAHC